MKLRHTLLLLASFWLAFGQLAGALAQSADRPCESMSMSMPADDCCGDGGDVAKCLSACAASAPAVLTLDAHVPPLVGATAVAPRRIARHPDISGPPDIAPPKPAVS